MVTAYLLEEMCRLCSFSSEYYKEAKCILNINHRRKETLNMTLEDEMPTGFMNLELLSWYVNFP